MGRLPLAVGALLLLTACGATSSPALFAGPPAGYLLTVDQLVAPGFSVDVAPHNVSATDIATGDAGRVALLAGNHLSAAAAADFVRNAGPFTELNGPAQVRDSVEVFETAADAAAVLSTDSRRLDVTAGSRAVSTGPLGDGAHATMRTATVAGVSAVQVTVEWRITNLVCVLVVRGRDGGTRLADALALAHAQTSAIEARSPTPA